MNDIRYKPDDWSKRCMEPVMCGRYVCPFWQTLKRYPEIGHPDIRQYSVVMFTPKLATSQFCEIVITSRNFCTTDSRYDVSRFGYTDFPPHGGKYRNSRYAKYTYPN